MRKELGRSIYISSYNREIASTLKSGAIVFISLHIKEEFDNLYVQKATSMIMELNSLGIRVVADVSKYTLALFNESDIITLAKKLNVYGLRIDDGYTKEEIGEIAKMMPVYINASCVNINDARYILECACYDVVAMHNFYPRVDTGLDDEFLKETVDNLHSIGLKVACFVPGDEILRGPIYEGLPTLERHRYASISGSYLELLNEFNADEVFVGDPGISKYELNIIRSIVDENIIQLPCCLNEGYEYLYNQTFTNRMDTPKPLIRFQESRTYAGIGERVKPCNQLERNRGTITMDNELYSRYSGEIQIVRSDLTQDDRVNVIGFVDAKYYNLMDQIKRGYKFQIIKKD